LEFVLVVEEKCVVAMSGGAVCCVGYIGEDCDGEAESKQGRDCARRRPSEGQGLSISVMWRCGRRFHCVAHLDNNLQTRFVAVQCDQQVHCLFLSGKGPLPSDRVDAAIVRRAVRHIPALELTIGLEGPNTMPARLLHQVAELSHLVMMLHFETTHRL
jgi:hypothetical protein